MSGKNPSRRRALKPVSEKGLRYGALKYLERYSTSSVHLRSLLERRVRRADTFHQTQTPQAAMWIDSILAECLQKGYLDDNSYARQLIRQGIESGSSRRLLRLKLAQKGIAAAVFEIVMASVCEEEGYGDTELLAAAQLIRKRHLGPFRSPKIRAAFFQKDMGVLARTGFDFYLSRGLLQVGSPVLIEAVIDTKGFENPLL